ncbi:hypothetical protein [Paenibacillus ginsengarvi]|uniref:Extracellular solute-binding protein n=1 Tax=Paenibacillus ginsengarvi TaxID=400777 RepID=A0A3B0AUC3_9BACL|nr:hypothetical protein [Paenibacillus ginsengarvi]RKN62867.1 hypothetical protein D7M11_34610 [Paenibacillus ginsengarvi]
MGFFVFSCRTSYYNLSNEMTSLQTNIDWDLAPLPASENKLPSSLVQFNSIYSIYSGTLQTEDSWKVVQFLNSDAMAKTNTAALTFDGKLPVRMKYLPDIKGRNLKAFYSLNTEERVVSPVQLPPVFLQAFHDLLNKAISDVLGNRQTVSEAIQAIQEQGGGLLLQHIEK